MSYGERGYGDGPYGSETMPQYMKVPLGETPAQGTVACRPGELVPDHNLWKSAESFDTQYTVLSEGEAQVEGLKMQPGTLLPAEVDSLQTEINDAYGIDIANVTVTVDGTNISLKRYLNDYTLSFPSDWPTWRRDPWRV